MEKKIKIEVELTEHEAQLIHTWIRRSIFEDYFERIADCTMTEDQAKNETYNTIYAFQEIQSAIEKNW